MSRVLALRAEGFRNLRPLSLTPGEGVNVIHGMNAQGKTNLLEALWLFTGAKSFRAHRDAELIQAGASAAALTLRFFARQREQEASLRIAPPEGGSSQAARRRAVLNDLPLPAPSRLAGRFCAVLFAPAHLAMVQGGPDGRRRFLDAAYCQLRPGYLTVLADYARTLRQRSSLLLRARRGERVDPDLAAMWEERLALAGGKVRLARLSYLKKLAPVAADIYAGLSHGRERLALAYTDGTADTCDVAGTLDVPAAELLTQTLRQTLTLSRDADLRRGVTTAGPHRDDLLVTLDGRDARLYGSQGQQRSAVLALKLAEARVLREVSGEDPVALLDDVMSELDEERQSYILNHIRGWQVFLTCCDPAPLARLADGRVFHIEQGDIRQ